MSNYDENDDLTSVDQSSSAYGIADRFLDDNSMGYQNEGKNVDSIQEPGADTMDVGKVKWYRSWTWKLLFTLAVLMMSSFHFGYAIGVLNGPQAAIDCGEDEPRGGFFKPCIVLSQNEKTRNVMWAVLVASMTLGGLFGGLSAGPMADYFGRNTWLWLINIPLLIAVSLETFFSSYYTFLIGRIMAGFMCGNASATVPMYIGEISPTALRGAFGVLPQFAVTTGIFVAQIFGIFVSSPNSRPWWRLLLGWRLELIILQMLLLPFCPKSPRWLIQKGKEALAIKNLKSMRPKDYPVVAEFDAMKSPSGKPRQKNSIRDLFRISLLKPLIIGIVLNLGQQLSGINVVFSYSTSIFQNAMGAKKEDIGPSIATAVVGFINVASTGLAAVLMDFFGRKTLLIIGEIGQIVFLILLSSAQILSFYNIAVHVMGILSIFFIIGFVIAFAIGLGPIPWLILSEIFPDNARGILSSICVGLNWGATFAVVLFFPIVDDLIHAYSFLPYLVVVVMLLFFTIFVVQETKGKTIDELTNTSSKE